MAAHRCQEETKAQKVGGNRLRNLLESMGLIEDDTASDGSKHAGENDTDANAAGVHLMARVVGEDDLRKREREKGNRDDVSNRIS